MPFKSLLLGLAAAATFAAAPAAAQGYPTKPITMIVPFAAGGPTDTIARLVGDHMGKTLGQQIVIENVAGAGGTTGVTRAATAAPDGYTIVMGHMGTHAASVGLYPNLKYDPRTSFNEIGLAASTPILIVAKKGLEPKNLAEFVAYAKAQGDKLTQAHAGVGSVSHTTCLYLNSILGTKPAAVAYRGTGPALNDLVAGQVDYMCDQIVNLVPQVQADTIKAYGVATATRSPALPNLPTTTEGGLPAYQITAWNALFAPKGIPAEVADKLTAALSKALDDETTRKRLLDLGSILPEGEGRGPKALAALVRADVDKLTPIIKAAGVTGN